MLDELKGIVKHSLLYGIGNWVRPILAFLMIPIYYNLLDPAVLGDYTILVLSVEVIGLIFGGRIDAAVTRYYFHRTDPEAARRVVSTALLLVLGIGSVLCLVGSLVAPGLVYFLFERRGELNFPVEEYAFFFRVVFLTLLLQLTSQVGAAYMRIRKKSLTFSIISILGLFLGLSLNILLLVGMGLGLHGILYSSIITNAFLTVIFCGDLLRTVPLRFETKSVRDLISFGLPLVPGSVAYFIITFGDNFVLNETRTKEEIAVYGLAYKFGILVSYAATKPFMEFWRVRAYELYARGRVRMKQRRAATYYTFCVLFLALMIAVLADEVIRIASSEYQDAAPLVPLLAMGYVFAGLRLVFELAIHMKKQTRYSSYVTLVSMALNVTLNVLLIPVYGIWGATISTFCTFALMAVGSWYLSERLFRIRYELARMTLLFVVAGALFAGSRLVTFSDVWASAPVKLLIGASYPVVLYFVGFFRRQEKRMIAEVWARLRGRVGKTTRGMSV